MTISPFATAATAAPLAACQVLRWQPDAALPGLAVHLVEFTAAGFTPASFAAAGLALPAHIERSVPKRQAEYFHGRLAARQALAAAGLAVTEIGSGAQREPLWPAGAVGSISHNSRRAAAVALPAPSCHGIGIDLESPASIEQQDSLATLAVDAAELALLAANEHLLPRGVLLALVFSAKESFYKAVFNAVGQVFDFDAIRLVRVAPDHLDFDVAQALCMQWQPGMPARVHYRVLPDGDLLTAFIW
ncbi:4'-phosphopantetheinyl transferase family protein [Pseudoduganella buxea]|nr:4'-phosphopantetheinyl transferase superfamily protein [Pseudoduganella buxea]MTV55062.1 4'-phosphopantetheinyl transferase superfamily protein [Pseudoduganella buxea]